MPTSFVDSEIRTKALALIDNGVPRREVQAMLNLKKTTLAFWIYKVRDGQEFRDTPADQPKVAHVRKVCEMLDSGVPLAQITRETGFRAKTIRRWRDDPKYRNATYEYDPTMSYDHTDLLDRATVAQNLCMDSDVGERLDLLFAVVGDYETIEAPVKRGYGRSIQGGQ